MQYVKACHFRYPTQQKDWLFEFDMKLYFFFYYLIPLWISFAFPVALVLLHFLHKFNMDLFW